MGGGSKGAKVRSKANRPKKEVEDKKTRTTFADRREDNNAENILSSISRVSSAGSFGRWPARYVLWESSTAVGVRTRGGLGQPTVVYTSAYTSC